MLEKALKEYKDKENKEKKEKKGHKRRDSKLGFGLFNMTSPRKNKDDKKEVKKERIRQGKFLNTKIKIKI